MWELHFRTFLSPVRNSCRVMTISAVTSCKGDSSSYVFLMIRSARHSPSAQPESARQKQSLRHGKVADRVVLTHDYATSQNLYGQRRGSPRVDFDLRYAVDVIALTAGKRCPVGQATGRERARAETPRSAAGP